MKRLSYISAVALILIGAISCQKNKADKPEGNVFSFNIATKSDAGTGKIGTCSIYVIRERDSMVLASRTATPSEGATSIVDTFRNLPFENCFVAAVANGNIIEKYTDSLEILHLKKGDKATSNALDRIVVCNSDSIAANEMIPYSGMARLDIAKVKTCSLDLKRILSRLNVTVKNNSADSRLVVDTIFFSKFKSDRVFLFGHNGKNPAGTNFSDIKGKAFPNDTIAANSSSDAISWDLFESSDAGYAMNLKLTVPEAGKSVTVENIPLILSDKVNEKESALNAIGRGESVNVTVNVYYDSKGNVFKFSVGNWESETINKNIN